MNESSASASLKLIETETWERVSDRKSEAELAYVTAKDTPLPSVVVTEVEHAVFVNGFRVPAPPIKHEDTSARDSALRSIEDFQKRLWKFESLLEERDKLTKALHEVGIEPIAVLPRRQWDGICKKFGLIRFENLNGSKTGVPGMVSFTTFVTLYLGTIVALLLLGSFSGFRNDDGFGVFSAAVLSVIWSGFIGCVGGWLALIPLTGIGMALKGLNMHIFLMKVLPRWLVARVLFVRGHDCSPNGNDKIFTVDINFPPAPQEVIGLVYKARVVRFDTCYYGYVGVAADPGAVAIDVKRTVSTWKQEERAQQADPIVYVWNSKNPLVVAIVAQYGNFVSEKRCLKAVRALGDEVFLA